MVCTQEMIRSTPHGWGADKLTNFLDITRRNQLSAYVVSPEKFSDLVEIVEILSVFSEDLLLPHDLIKFFIVRSGFSLKSASAMLACGDFSSAYAISRVALERASYAYYFSTDKELLDLWTHREKSSNKRKIYDRKFKMKTILHTIEKNYRIPKNIRQLYATANELGAHASGYDFVANSVLSSRRNKINLTHLHEPEGKTFSEAVDHIIHCGLGIFFIGYEIFKKRLANNSTGRANALAIKYSS